MASGTRIEVKTGAYIQSWPQQKLSEIVFSNLRSRYWDPEAGYVEQETYNAHIYIFCVQTAKSHEEYEPFDLDQWRFYVLPHSELVAHGTQSIRLNVVEKLAGSSIRYGDLKSTVEEMEVFSAQ